MAKHKSNVETIGKLTQFHVDNLGVGSSRTSDPFKIGLWDWRFDIRMGQSLDVYLYHESSKELVFTASFTLRMLVRGNNCQPFTCSSVTVSDKLLRAKDMSPYYDMSPYRELSCFGDTSCREKLVWSVKSTKYANFILEVEFHDLRSVSVNGDKVLSMWSSEEHIRSQAQNEITGCLSRMLDEGLHTDVTIFASSGSVGAHRAVLASRSPVFNSMFHHDLTEKQSSTVHINDMTLESCRALLHYLYGNPEHEEFQKHREALVRASHKYDIPDLKDACEESLLEDIDVHNVLARLHDSLLYQLGHLKRECLRYLLEFGKIQDLREEFNEFLREADKDLIVELVQEQLNFHTNRWLPALDLVKPEAYDDPGNISI